MSASTLSLLVAAEEAHRDLPMPAIAFAIIAFGGFLLALGVLWSFRNTAAKIAHQDYTSPEQTPGDYSHSH